MISLTVLRDSREQKPWPFESPHIEVKDVTLNTADYTIAEFCEYHEDDDTYYPDFAVERKAGQDFVQSITHERGRFKREIKRASSWTRPLPVVIEKPRYFFKRQRGFMKYRDVTTSQIFGTVDTWGERFNVEFHFCKNRGDAAAVGAGLIENALCDELL